MSNQTRMTPKDRKQAIVEAALIEATDVGYNWITREIVAARAQCSEGLINKYYGTMTQLKRAVVRMAIQRECLPVIAEAVANKSPLVARIGDDLRRLAIASLSR